MSGLKCVTQSIHVDLRTGCDIRNITNEVNNVIKDNKITTGIVNIFAIGSTGSVTTIEYEPGVVRTSNTLLTHWPLLGSITLMKKHGMTAMGTVMFKPL